MKLSIRSNKAMNCDRVFIVLSESTKKFLRRFSSLRQSEDAEIRRLVWLDSKRYFSGPPPLTKSPTSETSNSTFAAGKSDVEGSGETVKTQDDAEDLDKYLFQSDHLIGVFA